jgi:hypothetical protein
VAILNEAAFNTDPSNSETLTTKEVLKRYGDLRSSAVPQPSPSTTSPSSARPQRHGGRPGAVTHPDPMAWQNEASVRHIGGNGGYAPPPPPGGNGYAGLATPPPVHTPDYTGSPGQRSSARFAGPPGQQPQGPLGITGAG